MPGRASPSNDHDALTDTSPLRFGVRSIGVALKARRLERFLDGRYRFEFLPPGLPAPKGLDGLAGWGRGGTAGEQAEARRLGLPFLTIEDGFRGNYAQGLVFAELQNPIGERSTAFVRGQAAYRAFSEVSDADHSNLSLLAGVRTALLANLSLDLAGGAGAIGFDGFADAVRAIGGAHLRWRHESGLGVHLGADHRMTPNLVGDDVQETTVELGLERRFGLATLAFARVFAVRCDRDVIESGTNFFGAAEVGVRRQVTRTLEVDLTYRHWRNAGSVDRDDFYQNRVVLGSTLRY